MIQYNAALVITGANQTSRGLGLEFLAGWRWLQNIFLSKNIQWPFTCMLHVYSYCGEGVYHTGSTNQENLQLSTRIKTFESSLFPYCIKEWNNLSEKLCKVQFKIKTTSFIRLKENLIFEIHGINGIKLVNRLR